MSGVNGACLVCYDIADKRRLQRVHRYLKGQGVAIQYSVYYCIMSRTQQAGMLQALSRLIDPERDDVRVYPLSHACRFRVLGRGLAGQASLLWSHGQPLLQALEAGGDTTADHD